MHGSDFSFLCTLLLLSGVVNGAGVEMWCGPSLLLLLCCTLYGTDAQHEPNTSEAPRRDRTPTVTEAAAAAAGAPRVTASSPSSSSFSPSFSTAKVPTDSGQTQEPSTAEPLEDELSNQENVISQVSMM